MGGIQCSSRSRLSVLIKAQKYKRQKRREYRDKYVQPSLPKTRARALTFQGSSPQTSNLLLRLLLELRYPIYESVLGCHKIHLAFSFAPREYGYRKPLLWRWWHCICTWDQVTLDLDGSTRGPPNGMMGKLKLDFAILLTCRQIYSEAIDILYRTTTFKFSTRRLLYIVFRHCSIEMMWEFVNLGVPVIRDEDKRLYNDMWKFLASMPNLKYLKIMVAAYECPDPAPTDLQEVWLGPPAQLGKLDFFELWIPASYLEHFHVRGYLNGDLNFTLKPVPDIPTPG
ncbi:hypothetical protein F5884DRAFT_824420 [Xylogone sp. PMI_703]|nr:hypothetical protein F5884DRAFT_824420 [Xylogone sp. PMI_703]